VNNGLKLLWLPIILTGNTKENQNVKFTITVLKDGNPLKDGKIKSFFRKCNFSSIGLMPAPGTRKQQSAWLDLN
jgi:hypothetical protein